MSSAASQLVIEVLLSTPTQTRVSQHALSVLLSSNAVLSGAVASGSAAAFSLALAAGTASTTASQTAVTARLNALRALGGGFASQSAFTVLLTRIAPVGGHQVSQLSAAVLSGGATSSLASQLSLSVLVQPVVVSKPIVSQLVGEVLGAADTTSRVSQYFLSLLMWIYKVPMPAIYPTLPGLTYSVIKRPKWFTGTGTAASGREVRVAYATAPLWEWDLTYSWLPDEASASAASASDLKQLLGFYLSQSGGFGGFLFTDPDDYSVSGQAVATTDGESRLWTLIRTYGGSDGTGTEPIGYVDVNATFTVYLDGVVQDPSTYDLITTTPVNQQLRLHSVPTSGQLVSVDMQYYYYVRFQDDQYEFEKFMDRLWSVQKITLMSLRG